jgi:hypothetical protein
MTALAIFCMEVQWKIASPSPQKIATAHVYRESQCLINGLSENGGLVPQTGSKIGTAYYRQTDEKDYPNA